MRFTTISGSLYEVDEKQKKIRRLNGVANPSPRMGKDGQWRPYDELHLEVGDPAVILYGEDTPVQEGFKEQCEEEGLIATPMTTTTEVVDIDHTVFN